MKLGDAMWVVRTGGPEAGTYHGRDFCRRKPGGIHNSGCRRPILWVHLGTRRVPVDPDPDAQGLYDMHDCDGA